ncbi:hypothetical protein Mjas_05610 [Methanothermococcus sp. Ax23]|uniref:hypothetical protein n=1 Tax=Methanothermococcus sp. Ax23 TaxID=3156486 RepID=UPI003B9ECB02
MVKKEITNKDFYKEFIECLEKGEDFELQKYISDDKLIVEENINILKIYEEIRNKELKGATIEENDQEIIMTININIYIFIKLNLKIILHLELLALKLRKTPKMLK